MQRMQDNFEAQEFGDENSDCKSLSTTDSFLPVSDLSKEQRLSELAGRLTSAVAFDVSKHMTISLSIHPSRKAVIDGVSQNFPSLHAKIDALAESWMSYNATRAVQDFNHFSFFQILGCGPFALPILLQKLSEGEDSWIVALRAIAGEEVDVQDAQESPSDARETWRRWGEQHHWASCPTEALDIMERTKLSSQLESE